MLRFSVNVPPLAQDAKVEKDVKEETLSDLSETETDSEERWSLFSFVAL